MLLRESFEGWSQKGHLNIISLSNNVVDLKEIILELSLDYLVLNETKIHQGFSTTQF